MTLGKFGKLDVNEVCGRQRGRRIHEIVLGSVADLELDPFFANVVEVQFSSEQFERQISFGRYGIVYESKLICVMASGRSVGRTQAND